MLRCVLLAVFLAGALFLLPAPGPGAEDGKTGWIDLIDKDFSAWKGMVKDWSLVEAVQLDEKNPRLLALAGTGSVLANGPKSRAPDLLTRESFKDVEVHLEFLLSKGSNSGIKFHAHYEIQLFDSSAVKDADLTGADCGGIYPRAEMKPKYHHIDKGIPPRVNACKAPGEWQTLDVLFLAPRFDRDGKKTANARLVRALLNDKLIHEDQDLTTPTGHAYVQKEVAEGPLLLQGDHGPVAFRNVRVRSYQSQGK